MEHWSRAYREAPEIFDAFTRAEDPDGLVARRLRDAAALDGLRPTFLSISFDLDPKDTVKSCLSTRWQSTVAIDLCGP